VPPHEPELTLTLDDGAPLPAYDAVTVPTPPSAPTTATVGARHHGEARKRATTTPDRRDDYPASRAARRARTAAARAAERSSMARSSSGRAPMPRRARSGAPR
jgi:hypothetical protein